MGSYTDFTQVQGWFGERRDYEISEIVEFAEALRQITGKGALIVTDEVINIRRMLIEAVGAKWAQYEEGDLRGDWRNLWTPAGDPRQVVKRALQPFDKVIEHLTDAQLRTADVPKALARHLEPVTHPRTKRFGGFKLDDPDVW